MVQATWGGCLNRTTSCDGDKWIGGSLSESIRAAPIWQASAMLWYKMMR
jgi:hypothetical protein